MAAIRRFRCADWQSNNRTCFELEVSMTTSAALYLRVSTDGQDTANQRLELERVAAQRGWNIVAVFEDAGISGSKGRDKRPGFDKLHKAIVRHECDVAMAWSVDRLGRSMLDLVAFLSEVNAAGVGLYLHQQGLDTLTPAGRAMFGMMSVFSEFERAILVERTKAGLARARSHGTRSGKAIGRPTLAPRVVAEIAELRHAGVGVAEIVKRTGASRASVFRVRPAAAA
jgi:DNA invertase Pin-like site-specific DNA recombinase